MILDPRYFGLNDLLRRPQHQSYWGSESLALALQVDGEPLLPTDGHKRPSHNSLYGSSEISHLQVVQDSFTARDGTEVVSLLLRNPSSETVFVELTPQWQQSNGSSEQGWVHHCSPSHEDLGVYLSSDILLARSFTQATAETENLALKQATRWYFEKSPLTEQHHQFDAWCAANALLFDASDPWLTRLVAHSQALRWQGIEPYRVDSGSVTEWFKEGDFDSPRDDCPAWDRLIVERLVGVRFDQEAGSLVLSPDNFLGLSHFCLQGLHNTTIVWDDPTSPRDAYEDGDTGLTVYVGRVRAYNQPTLTPCSIPLSRSSRPF